MMSASFTVPVAASIGRQESFELGPHPISEEKAPGLLKPLNAIGIEKAIPYGSMNV